MNFFQNDLSDYVSAHTTNESAVLEALSRETHAKVLMPRMLSGHYQGRLLSMLSHMIRPTNILELGTYTGYSALCLAEGLKPGGKLYTIDINEERDELVQKYIKQSEMENKIVTLVGNALDIVPTLNIPFDLVFIDADKQQNEAYYNLLIEKIPSGSYILIDNVLWSGKVVNPNPDKDTLSILQFNALVQQDTRVENVLLPVRDGIMMVRKL